MNMAIFTKLVDEGNDHTYKVRYADVYITEILDEGINSPIISIIEDTSKGVMRVIVASPERDQADVYQTVDPLTEGLVFRRAYQVPFSVNLKKHREDNILMLEQKEFVNYMSLLSSSVIDSVNDYNVLLRELAAREGIKDDEGMMGLSYRDLRPSPEIRLLKRRTNTAVTSAQALRDFFWGYDIEFSLDKYLVVPKQKQEPALRYAKHNIHELESITLSLSHQDRDKLIADWIKKKFRSPILELLEVLQENAKE